MARSNPAAAVIGITRAVEVLDVILTRYGYSEEAKKQGRELLKEIEYLVAHQAISPTDPALRAWMEFANMHLIQCYAGHGQLWTQAEQCAIALSKLDTSDNIFREGKWQRYVDSFKRCEIEELGDQIPVSIE